MEKVQEVLILIEKHIDDIDFANSKIENIKTKIDNKKKSIKYVIEIEQSIKKNVKKVYIQFLYSLILIGFILYLLF